MIVPLSPDVCRLRPVTIEDGPRLLAWRNQDHVRAAMFTDHPIAADEHRAWMERLIGASDSLGFIFEDDTRPLGFVTLSEISRAHERCSWGFYIGEADAPAGSGKAMLTLALDQAFVGLKLNRLYSQVLAGNTASLRLHGRLGFAQEGRLIRHHARAGTLHDVLCLARFSADWDRDRAALAHSKEAHP
jgi:UDP-4-amino-4,6-dideoxy-N-acetyl-beta-L-altrosamine N-acetyltransferase